MNQIYCTQGKGVQLNPMSRHMVLRTIMVAILSVFFNAGTFAYPYPTIAMSQQGTAYQQPQFNTHGVSVFNNLVVDGSLYFLAPSCQLAGPSRTCESTDRVVFIGTADMVGMAPTYQFTLSANTANAVISGASSGSYSGPVQLALVPGPGGFFTANGSVTVTMVISGAGGVLSTCSQTLSIDPLPVANGAGLSMCVASGTTAVFNLASLNATITGGAANTVEWYSNALLTIPIANPASYTSASGVVYAKVESTTTGCCNMAPVTLAVVQSPACSITRPTQAAICANTSGWVFTAPADHAGYAWTVTGGTITAGQNSNQVTVSAGAAGTLSVSVVITNNNNCTSTCNIQVPINALPVCEITGNNMICVGQSTSFTATGGTSYSWTGPGGFTATTATISNLTTAGTYTVTVTNASGCTSTCSRTLTVNPLPVCNITGNNMICVGQSTSFTATGGTSYSWTGPGGFTATTATISNLTTAGTYTVTVTNANGCTSTCTRTLTVNPLPVCTITRIPSSNVCANSMGWIFNVPAGATGYTWTVSGGTITAGQNSNQVTVNAGASGTLIVGVTVSNASGCSSTCSVQVPINALPVCEITGNNMICTGQSTSFTATGGTSYSWTGPGGFTATGATISNLTAPGVYTVVVTNAAGCISTCTRTLTVNPAPVCEITGNNMICAGQSTSFTATGGTSYSWTGPGGFTATTATISNLTAAGTYTVTVTNASGCTSTCSRTLTVNPLPVCNITGNNMICVGQNTSFTATGGTSYSWTGPGGFTATGATISNLTVAGTYTVTITNASGCTATCSRTLTVNAAPVCEITGNNNICAGQSASFTATGGTSYSWTGPGGFTATTATISNLTVAGTYTVVVTNANGCTSTCSRTLAVSPAIVCNITGNNVLCPGQSTSFTATGGTSYSWTGPGGFTATGATISNLATAGTYTVTVTNAAGCTATCSRTLSFSGAAECAITGVNVILPGGSTTFTATGGTSYSWTGPGGFTATGAVIAGLTVEGTYTVTVTNAAGCTSTCSRFLNVQEGGPLPCLITGPATACPGITGLVFSAPAGYQAYTWSVTGGTITAGTGTNSITVTAAGAGTLVVSLTAITANVEIAMCTRNVTVAAASPCMLAAPAMLPACGSTGNTLTGPAGYSNYVWTVSGNGTYVSGNGTATLTYNVGASGNITVTLTATAANGCVSTCTVTFGCGQMAGRACSQGFYKTHPEVWDSFSDILVAGGTVGGVTYPGMPVSHRFITSTDFYTYYNIPAGSISGIPAGSTMHEAGSTGGGNCINLARQGNAALLNTAAWGSGYLSQTPYANFISLYNAIRAAFLSGNCGSLATQLDMYNNNYDHDFCSDIPGGARGSVRSNVIPERQVSVTSYPNPFTDRINFSVHSKVAGMGTLEVFGMMGEKVKTIFSGYIEKDGVRTFSFDVPVNLRKSMIYQFKIGDQLVTGKLVYPN